MTEVLTDRLKTALASRYAVERQIGQGGMATVYLARDLRHNRKVALKVLRPELAARHANYDVHPDGQRFIFLAGENHDSGDLVLVQNVMAAAMRSRNANTNR